jgi:ATP/maltotriose-dependent transcriptional regulator MalT
MGFGLVDLILGACMQARHFIEVLRKGDRFQVLRATGIEIVQVGGSEKPETKRERALVQLGRSLAERDGSDAARHYFAGSLGMGLYLRGLWKQSNSTLGILDGVAPMKSISMGRLFLARTYFYLGEPKECAKREARLYTEAQDRGDLSMTVNMRTSTHVRKWLAADDPERARREVREALAEWSQTGFFLQHWQAMIYEPDIDLYAGDGARAYERFSQDLPALGRSLLLRSVMIRATTFYARGRLAIATIESQPERRGSRIAEARRMVRKLRRESSPWAAMMAALVEAVADNAAGD